MNITGLPVVRAIGHVPLLDATWTLLRDGCDVGRGDTAFAEWECIAPECHVLVRLVIAPADEHVPIETYWQETVVWHERPSPSQPPREPMVPLLLYAKELFVGTHREAVVVFPPRPEIPDGGIERVSLFTLLGTMAARPHVARCLPRFFTFLPPLP